MINDKAILVGVDGSHASYKATWWAANYAKHAGLTLQIVCAYSLPSYAAVSFDATYTAMGDDNAGHNVLIAAGICLLPDCGGAVHR